ncbi:MAG: flagellar hook-length control protein FliK [Gammaproteobacteria bacterium]|nr:MAG: flagellar hook-length control protein FliK [Gammaproteobacteria bacterium]
MDITNIPQNLIKALEQKNTEQLVALSRVLNLVLGKTVMATVTSTTPVTEPERQILLKQTVAALTQINKQVSDPTKISPAIKAELSRLMQQQDLIKMPELKWVNVLINNRPQLTYTDHPLAVGQNIPVQLQSPQKLVLLDMPELDGNDTTGNPAKIQAPIQNPLLASKLLTDAEQTSTQTSGIPVPNAKNIAMLNELLKNALAELSTKANQVVDVKILQAKVDNLILEKNSPSTTTSTQDASSRTPSSSSLYNPKDISLKFSAAFDNVKNSPEIISAKTLVSENLRNLLPHKDVPNVLFGVIAQLGKLNPSLKAQLFSPSLEQALKSVAEKIRSPATLGQPKALAQALKNSGVFLEQKLNQVVQSTSTKDASKLDSELHKTYNLDVKGSLLTLLNRVTQDISGETCPPTNEQTQKLLQQITSGSFFNPSASAFSHLHNSKQDISQAIGVFIQQLMQKPVKELSNKELRNQLLVLLQQNSIHSLVKIQLQQLHAINHELDTKESSTPNASWQLEIPVRHHNEVQQLHVRIDREWVDGKNESDSQAEKNANKIKQWSVTLRFDLPTLGEFCAQLVIVDTQVSATLWAAKEKTFTQIHKQIEGLRKQLESEGMKVKYLQCMRGIPPEKPMALSYSLIDVST